MALVTLGVAAAGWGATTNCQVQSFPLNPYVAVLDGQWQGIKFASDGNCYFASSTHDNKHGAAFFRYAPATGALTMLAEDITRVCGEDPRVTPPQGKIHSNITEYNGWLYFGTFLANNWPEGEAAYTGGHVIGYELATGKFKDFGVIRANYAVYAGLAVDPVRNKLIVHVVRWWGATADSHIYRIDLATGTKEYLGAFPSAGAAFYLFVDKRGDCWISQQFDNGTLMCVRSATGLVERWADVLPEKNLGSPRCWEWSQPLPDGDRCVFRLQFGTGLHIFDSSRFPADPVGAFHQIQDIGPSGAGIVLNGDRIYYVQRANRQDGAQEFQDFHLLSAALDPTAVPAIRDHGLMVDQSGRLVWRVMSLAADPRNQLYMVGDWWLLLGEQGTSTGTLRHVDGPGSNYVAEVRGQFFAVGAPDGGTPVPPTPPPTTDQQPPWVALLTPTNGQIIANSCTLSATATDNVAVANLQFQIDGCNCGAPLSAPPYSVTWDSRQLSNGPHTLTAVVLDTASNKVTSAAATLTVSNPVDTTSGLIAFWSFNPADVNGNTWFDRSGNGSDATSYNTLIITGVVSQARRFTGNAAYAVVPSDSNLRLTGDRTFGFWIRTSNSTIRWSGLFSRYEASGSEAGYLVRTSSNGVLEVRIGGGNMATGGSIVISDTQKINDGKWHYAVVNIKIGSGVTFYVDGARTSSTAVPILAGTGGAPFQIGANPWLHWGDYFDGDLDEVRVYNRTLSDAETAALYDPNLVPDTTAPNVSLTNPTINQTVTGTVAVAATATDNRGVVGVQFKIDGANLGAEDTTFPYSAVWNTVPGPNGAHSVSAIARDAASNLTTVTVAVTVNNDLTPPSVLLTSPGSSQVVSGSVPVNVTASDNVGVAGVQFQLDGINLGSEHLTAPYNFAWDSTSVPDGPHTLLAIARDAAGYRGSNAVPFIVKNTVTPSTVAITAPGNRQSVSNSVAITATATADTGVAGVRFRLDGATLGAEDTTAPYGITWNTFLTANGVHTLTAISRELGGNVLTSTPVSVTVSNDLTAPTVAITSPGTGQTVSNTVTVTATATDNVSVAGVQFKVDGVAVGAEDTSAPYSYDWDTTLGNNGPHILTAVARDPTGNQSNSVAVTVTVGNPANLTAGLLGFWTFDAADVSGNTVADRSGNGGTATLYNTTAIAGQVGQARRFAGAGNYALVTADSNLLLTGDRTFALWVRTTNASRYEGLISRYSAAGTEFGYLLRTTPGGVLELRLGGNNLGTGASRNIADTRRINDGLWHHVVVQIKIGNAVTFYIDGVRSSSTAADVRTGTGGATFQLGSNPWLDYGNYLNGDLDQVRIYNRILPDNEVLALFQEASGGDKTPPTATMTAPLDGQVVSGTVPVSATATDNVGVVGVQFTIDGANFGPEVLTPPYTIAWDTKQSGNGPHSLAAVARDAGANQTTATAIGVTVSNTVILTDGLIAFWSFDAADVNGSILYDRSGNASHAVGYNTSSVTGKVAQARRFTGASSYALVSADANLRLTGDRTFSFWLRTTNNSRYEGLLCRYDASGAEFGYIVRTTPGGVLEVRLGGNNITASSSRNITDTKKINDGNWHYATVILKIGTGVTFYVDGVRTTSTAVPILAGTGGSPFQLGSNPWLGYGNYFTGDLDQVRVYNRVLSDADVSVLYQEGAAVSNLVAANSQLQTTPSNSSLGTTTAATSSQPDTDGDGLTDQQEALAGTDPASANSRLRVLSIVAAPTTGAVTLTWTSVPGRAYQVQYRDTPGGPWLEDLPGSQLTAGPSQSALVYTDTTAPLTGSRYYQVRLVLSPGAPAGTVATESVGVSSVTLLAGDNPLAVPWQRLGDYRGPVVAVANSNTVTLGSAAGFVPGQFGPQNGRTQYLLLVRQDAAAVPGIAGDWWPITGNTAAQIAVANGPDDLSSLLAAGTQIEIRHLVTVKDLFGAALSGSDQLWLGARVGLGAPVTYQAGGTPGYYQNGGYLGDGSTLTLDPDQAVTLSRPAGAAAVTLRWAGQVQVTALTHYLLPGIDLIGNPFPVAARLDQSGLAAAGWLADVNLQPAAAEDDLFQTVGPVGLGVPVYYHNGAAGPAGWYVGGVLSNSMALLPGQAYRFSIKEGTGMLRWRQPVPVIP